MYRYKIMIIDDRISNRIRCLEDFLTNSIANQCKFLKKGDRGTFIENSLIEFEIIYPGKEEILGTYIENNRVDAYFLDVIYDNVPGWNLQGALQAIRKCNPNAPIFMYSSEWETKAILDVVSQAFKHGFPGKTASYFYDLNKIGELNEEFKNADNETPISNLNFERNFIKDVIVKAYGMSSKVPKASNQDVAILHISDMQYGDSKTTPYGDNLWQQVVKICGQLEKDGKISGIDLVAITGDISMHGYESEMEQARADLKKFLFKKLWKNEYNNNEYKERVLLVPGNHDFDLNFCTLDYLSSENINGKREIDFEKASQSLGSKKRKKKNSYKKMGLTAYRDFAYKITGDSNYHMQGELNFVNDKFKSWNLNFVHLNTCSGICAEETNAVVLDKEEIREIVNEMETDESYTIVLSHHTPLVREEVQGQQKEVFVTRCKMLLNSLNTKVWLGGHHHREADAFFSTISDKCRIYETATTSLDEKWGTDNELAGRYKLRAKDGTEIQSFRGFQIILLKKTEHGYEPEVFHFRFDNDGVPHEIDNKNITKEEMEEEKSVTLTRT